MQGRTGYLEMIADGTLAIAHADLLDPHQQALLATYLKLGWFHRLYGQHSVRSATRIVFLATGDAATVLGGMIPELRELLAPSTVELPPLTLRLKDIPLLASHFLHHHAARVGKRALGLSREAVDRLVSYAWPGNVTELENVMQRAAIVAREDDIIPADLIFVAPPEKDVHKINLLRNEKVRAFLRRPRLMQTFIWINIGIVALVTAYTLWGGIVPAGSPLQDAATNPGMLITWLIWFPLLPVSAFLIGRIWCGMCPIAGIGDLVARIKRYSLPVPKLLKRADFWLLAGAFIVVDYIEEVAGIADRPFATAVFLLLIVYLAAAFTVLFERKAFCRYLCPLAGVLGAYSTMSLVEVRGNKKVCQTQCGEHTCFKGTKEVEGCPLSSYPASMATNAECMMCGNCLRSCEHRGVQVNLRPPLQELWRNPQPTLALSLFGVVLVGLMAKHQFPKLASWQATQARLGWSDGAAHTILFLLFLVVTLVAFAVSASLSAAASQEKPLHNMARYGIAFIPLAFSGHVAHLTHEFLDEGIYDLLGYLGRVWGAVTRGAAIGAQAVTIPRFVNPSVLTFIKFLLVSGGFLGTLIALVMIGRKASAVAVGPRVLPHVLLAVAAWVCYLAIFTGTTGEVGGAAAPVAGIVQHLAGAGGP
jgi:polyferredoxin